MRGWLATWCLLLAGGVPAAADDIDATEATLDVRLLNSAAPSDRAERVTSGDLDSYFEPTAGDPIPGRSGTTWLKLRVPGGFAIAIHAARQSRVELFAMGGTDEAAHPLPVATTLAGFRGTEDTVYAPVTGLTPGKPLYARIGPSAAEPRGLRVSAAPLEQFLERGAEHARVIDFVVGALSAMALSALLIWFVLADKLFILYSTLFFLQTLYIAFLSGQAFDWPLLSYARPLTSFAWNVPVGLSGAVACLFTREIADLKHDSPRVYRAFGWFAAAFVWVTIANVAKFAGYGLAVNALGNLIFFAAAVFTLVVAYRSWRRGNRAAGWFMIAWTLLEGFTIAAALRFLVTTSEQGDSLLYYYGLPLSMMAAAVLIALGVADRLRQQRAALNDAERRAQTDPLTGVLNRRSLIERLDAAGLRARARGLPIALLFIDLDHFKTINDSYGHPAGDACLRAIIGPIQSELRQSDVIGRYGGEEFVVILSSADCAAASLIAERIRERVAAVRIEGFGEETIRLTCSIGLASSNTLGVWGEQLIARADAAVYAAKRAGRNQVQPAAA